MDGIDSVQRKRSECTNKHHRVTDTEEAVGVVLLLVRTRHRRKFSGVSGADEAPPATLRAGRKYLYPTNSDNGHRFMFSRLPIERYDGLLGPLSIERARVRRASRA